MDPIKDKSDIDKLLESLDINLTNSGACSGTISTGYNSDTITITSPTDWDYSAATSYSNTVIGGGYTVPNASITATSHPYTISSSTGITQPWFSNGTTLSTPKIKLDGEGADIEVNGWSLIDAIQKIEERLNILHPNEKLEAEWEELRALGEQYRKLEQHIKDKQATWDRLKAMPPPVVE